MDRDGVELESQVILRLPEAPAIELGEILGNGAVNLKDRLRLKLENDLRHGTLYFDQYIFPCKIVDIPCVIESHKTIDRKNIYKTADICQMIVCMEEEEPEEVVKPQKKTSLKVDKKYLFPHGVTPPLKCVRKRRFRRTLKKKQYSDQPEIEKEVRRLLRADYEAVHICWEVFDDDQEDKNREGGAHKDAVLMQGSKTNEDPPPTSSDRLAEEQIFGEALSDSDADDEDIIQGGELDDESRISMDDMDDSQSRQSDSMASSSQMQNDNNRSSYTTSFQDLFISPSPASSTCSSVNAAPSSNASSKSHEKSHRTSAGSSSRQGSSGLTTLSRDELFDQLSDLRGQLTEVSARRQIQETELSTMDNVALRNRLESVLNKLVNDQKDIELQIRDVEGLLNQY